MDQPMSTLTKHQLDHLQVILQIKCLRKLSKSHGDNNYINHVNTCSYCHNLSLEMIEEFNHDYFKQYC